MKIGIVIPWREQPSRVAPFKMVTAWYEKHFPEAKIYLADAPGDKWKMSASRNLGVRMAEEDGCDIIILNDADTLPELQPVLASINQAYVDGYIHNPYNEYRLLSHTVTDKFLNGEYASIFDCPFTNVEYSSAGTWIFAPETWWSIGGGDENFHGWGWEDTALEHAHKIVKGIPFKKHAGSVVALEHEWADKKDIIGGANHQRYLKYLEINNKDSLFNFINGIDN